MDNPEIIGPFKTGQRVPVSGVYVDQHGCVSHHDAHRTFPPCVNTPTEVAYRTLRLDSDRPEAA